MEALKGATLAGLGIACMPDFLVREALMTEGCGPCSTNVDGRGRFRMLWPSNRHLSPKVRVFVDFLPERLAVGR